MKTVHGNFEPKIIPLEQLYLIYGGNDGDDDCDPVRCEAYDLGIWVGEGLKVVGALLSFGKAFKSLKKN